MSSTTATARSAEHVLRRTSTGVAPWVIVDGTDPQYRAVQVGPHAP